MGEELSWILSYVLSFWRRLILKLLLRGVLLIALFALDAVEFGFSFSFLRSLVGGRASVRMYPDTAVVGLRPRL